MPPAAVEPSPRPFARILSTSLLDDIWINALDPGYREAHDARATPAPPLAPRRRRTAVVLTSVAIGAAVAAGATQVHRNVLAGQGTKTQLIAQVGAAERAQTSLAASDASARTRLAAARSASLARTSAGDRAAAELDAAELASAVTPVNGPGVVLRLTDGPPSAATTVAIDPARITDVDLRQAVNALWAGGAEAIAVNGLRLGPLTAIRTAGSAVLVDFRPVSSPYDVEAVGATNALEQHYASSGAAARLSTLAGLYGMSADISAASALHLAGTSGSLPVHAQPLGGTP